MPPPIPAPRRHRGQEIATALREEIARGHYPVGSALPAVKALCEAFKAGQKAVQDGIKLLSEEGLLEVKPRSGCYVLARPSGALGDDQASPAGAPASGAADLRRFLAPNDQDCIRIYICELDPVLIAHWRELLGDRPGLELLTCHDGHLQELLRHQRIDLVEGTPELLRSLDGEDFVPPGRDQPLPADWWDALAAPVRAAVAEGAHLPGIPFRLTVQYCYRNLELAQRLGWDEPAQDVIDLLERAAALRPPPGIDVLAPASLLDCCFMYGVVGRRGDALVLDDDRALELFTTLHGCGLATHNGIQVEERFAGGGLLFHLHCSFQAPGLLANARFPWRAEPLPLSPGVRMPGWLSVLAINRRSQASERCRELVAELCSLELQRSLAALHGNLPVVDAALPAIASPGGEVGLETARTQLAHSDFAWPARILTPTFTLERERLGLLRGALEPEAVLSALRWHLDFVQAPT